MKYQEHIKIVAQFLNKHIGIGPSLINIENIDLKVFYVSISISMFSKNELYFFFVFV